MPVIDTGQRALTLIVKVRDVLNDIDVLTSDSTIYRAKLTVSIISPTAKAGTAYESLPIATDDLDVDDASLATNMAGLDLLVREREGVYSFYAAKTDAQWDALFEAGYVLDFKWCYYIDGEEYTETHRFLWREEYRNAAPTLNQYTKADLDAAVEDFLGGSPGAATTSQIVNEGLVMLYAAHDWSFLDSDTTHLDVYAGIPSIELPENFLSVRGLARTDSTIHRMVPTNIRKLRRLREQNTVEVPNVTYYSIRMDTRDPVGRPRMVMEVWPTPSTTLPNAYTLDFARVPPALSADSDVPILSYGMEPLARQAVRLRAAEIENHDDYPHELSVWNRLLPMFAAMDSQRIDTPHLGQIGTDEDYQGFHYPINPDADLDEVWEY